jgi:hypothetical protein
VGQTSRAVIVTAAAERARASTAATPMIQSLTDPAGGAAAVCHSLTVPLASPLASLPSGPNATSFTPLPACRGEPAGWPVAGFHRAMPPSP